MRLSWGSIIVGLVAGAVGSGAVVAVAAIPDSATGKITACYATRGGDVRVINAERGVTCKNGERKVAWNQKGPRGARGAAGADGADGTAVAYAYVESTGNVPADRSSGITDAMVTKGATGVYCFELSSLGTVRNVIVSAENSYGSPTDSDKIATAQLQQNDATHPSTGCSSDTDMIVVTTDISDAALADWFFYVTLN